MKEERIGGRRGNVVPSRAHGSRGMENTNWPPHTYTTRNENIPASFGLLSAIKRIPPVQPRINRVPGPNQTQICFTPRPSNHWTRVSASRLSWFPHLPAFASFSVYNERDERIGISSWWFEMVRVDKICRDAKFFGWQLLEIAIYYKGLLYAFWSFNLSCYNIVFIIQFVFLFSG